MKKRVIKMCKIGAGIVLYNPNIEILSKNINAIIDQVEVVILIDNGSKNLLQVKEKINTTWNRKISLLENKNNDGIARALNQIMLELDKRQIKWGLTLDQDSICPENMVIEYKQYSEEKDIGIICPYIKDRNDQYNNKSKQKVEEIKQCITSGALTNVEIWKKVGGFDEKMFIDYVDFEYCMKLMENSYKIIRLNNVELSHQCGNLKVYNILGRKVQITNHNPVRCYYIIRNVLYSHRKHPEQMTTVKTIKVIIEKFIKVIVFEKEKLMKIKKMLKGMRDSRSL